jgi:hypothetical protein
MPTTTTATPSLSATVPRKGTANSRWPGSIVVVNRVPPRCDNPTTLTVFLPQHQGQRGVTYLANTTVGPNFNGPNDLLGIQENIFSRCAYNGPHGNRCAFGDGMIDNPCFQFRIDDACNVIQNDCPFPSASNGNMLSPAPDGAAFYTISGTIESNVCVLTVAPRASSNFQCHPN